MRFYVPIYFEEEDNYMTIFPCAKINLGLNIVSKRPDGYHNLETVFYPIPLHDTLEVHTIDNEFPTSFNYNLKVTGTSFNGDEQDNLVVKAYKLLANDFQLPRLHIHLHKEIPTQAGMGGGSSDAAFMLKLINNYCKLQLTNSQLEEYAVKIGADCPFFINCVPAYAEGIGEQLTPIPSLAEKLSQYYIIIVKPLVSISTKGAFGMITPQKPVMNCKDIIDKPIKEWKELLFNDFEAPIFNMNPELKDIKEQLYLNGAEYAAMSGSGSTIFGLFAQEPTLSQLKLDVESTIHCIKL
ncbi:4-(cytidine 5'-diphospho)-2-C-methyl-D-erythritol kinase (plasmid) [Prevotella sp. oral taxon 299 str. F0039]|nr:4-(cytidine 5'-diphospho)-2-C-methyl-D-erythritol kinase [Prevotella sp. oral taxon 299 str. F0039]